MRLHVLATVLGAWLIGPGLVHAQISNPVFKDDGGAAQNVVFKPADQAGDLQHGKKLRVTLKGKEITGIVVRTDKAARKIYLRTEPGAPPLAFDADDANIKKVEKATIKQVAFIDDNGVKKQQTVIQDIYQPEIQPFIITNGTRRTVSYQATTLSPGEMSQLRELESAENELDRVEYLASRELRVLDTDIAIQSEEHRRLETFNELLWRSLWNPGVYELHPWWPGEEDAFWRGPKQTARQEPFAGLPSSLRQGATVFPGLPVAADTVTKARQQFTSIQNAAVFEQGRLVAVIAK